MEPGKEKNLHIKRWKKGWSKLTKREKEHYIQSIKRTPVNTKPTDKVVERFLNK